MHLSGARGAQGAVLWAGRLRAGGGRDLPAISLHLPMCMHLSWPAASRWRLRRCSQAPRQSSSRSLPSSEVAASW